MSSPTDSSKASSLVYRVSGLPSENSVEKVGHLLARALRTPREESGLSITSLAVDRYQAASRVATVAFSSYRLGLRAVVKLINGRLSFLRRGLILILGQITSRSLIHTFMVLPY